MTHDHRASRWFRHRAPPPASPEHLRASNTPNTATTTSPPSLSQPANPVVVPELEPPPPYSPPSYAASQLPSPPQIVEAPPGYEPATAPIQIRPPAIIHNERKRLAQVLASHPWRRIWGPQPTSFGDALNKGALLGLDRFLLALLDAGAEVQGNVHKAIQVTTPIHEALRGPKPWLALDLINHQVQRGFPAQELVESRDANSCTPLHIAAEAGETNISRSLITFHGASVDAVDKVGRTPLHMAARYGRVDTADMLLDCGADPAMIDQKLWWRAGDRAESLLGSYSLISQMLNSATERRAALEFGTDEPYPERDNPALGLSDRDSVTEVSNLAAAVNNLSVGSSAPVSSSTPRNFSSHWDGYSGGCAQPSDPAGGSSSSRPRHRRGPRPQVKQAILQRIAQHDIDDIDVAHRMLRKQAELAVQRRSDTMFGTPQYAIWKRDCETLQEESRAQKARNLRETGNLLDIV